MPRANRQRHPIHVDYEGDPPGGDAAIAIARGQVRLYVGVVDGAVALLLSGMGRCEARLRGELHRDRRLEAAAVFG